MHVVGSVDETRLFKSATSLQNKQKCAQNDDYCLFHQTFARSRARRASSNAISC